ncbi:hypothetical protein SDC9_180763 [bioreactor metagenome]|uniref:Uncharacterized protein n=1 Tax=bioreactor metagenome TaxID=1076179 RepID=A0A645H2N4_9ZZZZ
MHEKSSDKFLMPKSERFFRTGFVVLHPKSNRFVANLKEPGVADGDPMGISAQILNHLIRGFERFFEVGNPFFGIKLRQELVEFARKLEQAQFTRESQSLFE